MQENTPLRAPRKTCGDSPRLSYKFQRLREQLRADIVSGALGEKLPGERKLGQRYNANAKTINKALGDLTSEGLLVRHIGRGTFVAGSCPESTRGQAKVLRCLHLETHTQDESQGGLLEELRQRAVAGGGCLEDVPVRGMADLREIRLQDWPAPMRSTTSGLIFVTPAPLAGGGGHPGEDVIMEAYRRHVPSVLAGSLSGCQKINAVVPDYVDAGYRLGEHLFQVGCERVVAVYSGKSREAEAVLSGCRSAATRYGRGMRECLIDTSTEDGGASRGSGFLSRAGNRPASRIGVVCIGAAALQAVRQDSLVANAWESGRAGLACIVDPGQTIARDRGITSYEVATGSIARWALWLSSAASSGRRPVEMIIPGRLEIRRTIAPTADAPLDSVEERWPKSAVPASVRLAEVAI